MKEEFDEAVSALRNINFASSTLNEINVFETTIRYMGGFLSANDLSGGRYPVLLEKAVELGEMLYHVFDTPNRLPILRWSPSMARRGIEQEASENVIVAEIGSLTLEFTRLTQVTGDPRYYSAVAHIMNHFDAQQNQTKLPGLFPLIVDAKHANFTQYDGFTLGGMVDSLYEYLPKVGPNAQTRLQSLLKCLTFSIGAYSPRRSHGTVPQALRQSDEGHAI